MKTAIIYSWLSFTNLSFQYLPYDCDCDTRNAKDFNRFLVWEKYNKLILLRKGEKKKKEKQDETARNERKFPLGDFSYLDSHPKHVFIYNGLIRLPFSKGALLYFSNRLTAIASNLTLAAGYSFNTSHISFFDKTNKSLYPTERTEAVLRLPIKIKEKRGSAFLVKIMMEKGVKIGGASIK